MYGAAIATVISFFLVWFIRLQLASRKIHWKLSIKRDAVAYTVLIVQVGLDHLEGHCYIGQCVAWLVLFFLYLPLFLRLFNKICRVAGGLLIKERK